MDETTPRRSSLAWSLKLDSPGRYPLLLSRLGLSLFGPDDQHNPPARMALIISLGGRLARFGPSLVWLALAGMLPVGSPGSALLWSGSPGLACSRSARPVRPFSGLARPDWHAPGRLARYGPSLVSVLDNPLLSLCPLLGRLLGLSRQVLLPWSVRVSPHD